MCVCMCVCVSGNTESSGAEEVLGLYFIAIKMNLNYLKQRNTMGRFVYKRSHGFSL